MSISLNRVQPARMLDSAHAGIVPAAVVWEPREVSSGSISGGGVRRLSRENRTGELVQEGLRELSRVPLRKSLKLGESAQAYLGGVAFGLLLALGLFLGASLEEPMPTSTRPVEELSVPVG